MKKHDLDRFRHQTGEQKAAAPMMMSSVTMCRTVGMMSYCHTCRTICCCMFNITQMYKSVGICVHSTQKYAENNDSECEYELMSHQSFYTSVRLV